MSSLKMTFSLTSLILIFGLAFVAMPAMAATGGPTVAFEQYSGVEDPDAVPGTQEMHTQARDDFRVKLTFSDPVETPVVGESDVQYRLAGTNGRFLGAAANVQAVSGVYVSGEAGNIVLSETEFVVTLPSITNNEATQVIIIVPEDAVSGSTLGNNLGNVAGQSQAYTLPALLAPVTVKFGDVTPVENTSGQQYTVNVIFEDTTDAADQALTEPSPALVATYITVMPTGGATVTVGAGVAGADGDTTPTGVGEFSYPLTISLAFGVDPIDGVTIGVDPGYALMADGMPATVDVATTNMPPAWPANTEAAEVSGMVGTAITAVNAGGATDPEGDTITYSWDASDDLGLELDENTGMISGTPAMAYDNVDGSDAAVMVTATATGGSDMRGVEITITAVPPSVAMTASEVDTDERTFRLDVTFTGAMPELTAFDATMLEATDNGDSDVTLTVEDQRFNATGQTYVALLKYNILAELPLTVTTVDSFATSDDPKTTAMVEAPEEPMAPAAPTNVAAVADQATDMVTLTWDASDGATGYKIAQTGTASDNYTATASPFTTPALAAGTYMFTVTASNAVGDSPASDPAVSATIDPPPVTSNPPAAAIVVSEVDVDARTFKVTVTLTPAAKSDGSDGDDVIGFDSTYLDITDASGDVGITASAERKAANSYIAILTYDELSVLPLTVTVDQMMLVTSNPTHSAMVEEPEAPMAPATPTGVAAVADQATDMVTLTWDASEGATGYKIAQTGAAAANYTATASPFTTPALAAGDYMFTVTASNAVGDSAASASVSATIDADPTAPGAPTAVTATADQTANTITISWTAPADDGGSAITGYTVTKHYMMNGTAATKDFSAAASPLTIPPAGSTDMLPEGVSFTFTVKAINSVGSGPASAASNAVTITPDVELAPPAAPAGLTATAGDAQVTLKWTASTDTSIIGYEYSDDGNAWAAIADSDATTSSHTVTGLTNGTAYTFHLRAVNAAGDGAASTANTVTPMAPIVRPGVVTNLIATPGDTQVTLNWTAPTAGGAVNNYYYSMSDGYGWRVIPNSNATTVMYTVTGLTNGQTYNFIVRAANSAGFGQPSNEISATPRPDPVTPPVVDTTPPTVTISASPNPINCDTGSTLSFAFSEALAANEAVAASELTVSAGWKAMADGGAVKIVPMGDGSEIGVTTVSVSVNAGAVKDAAGNGNAASTAMTFTVGPVLTIPAGGYIVVIRPEHMHTTHLRDPLYIGSTGVRAPMVDIQTWECMPDLTIFFGRSVPAIGGGAIVIKEADGPMGHDPNGTLADIAKGSVGLSEIMWASDEGIAHGGIPVGGRSNIDQAREQWIELHNRNTTAVKVTLFARPTNSALTTEADELDRVSNYNINRVWEVPGQSGNSDFGINFVSMQRGKHDNKGLAPTAAEGYAHGDWNGTHSNRWSASTLSYLTRRSDLATTGQLAAENLNYDFVGTPGRNNKPGVSTPILRTNVPKNSIVFNEIANRRDQTLEWIELKNVSDGEVNLKKYQISLATAKGTDVALYTFPDNDNIKLAAGELLLLLDTDPRDNDNHPIAVAFNRDGGNDQGLGIGPNAIKYKVANFREGGLPDNGNFVLYLRNRNDRLKSREGVIDVIGWSDKLADSANHTQLWPLQVIGTPDNRNSIAVETVHRRQHLKDPDQYTHGDKKDEHVALRDVGYTGIGYKRHAQRIAVHGGTPGYEDTRKNLVADVAATGVLTISDIMYDQGDGAYPQWIEIYNSSDLPVNLHSEAGWRLVIENFDDDEIAIETLSGTLNFKNSDVQTILPHQTVMVTSTRARNSGSAFFDTRVVFPATRVFSAWDDQRGELTRAPDKGGRPSDPILSTEGFYIELIDGKGNVSDGVGNLVKSPNRRVAAEKAWELSEVAGGMTEADGRSSILRRYRKPGTNTRYSDAEILDMGIEAAGWISAHITDFLDVRQTWYGDDDDYGSPGITGGRVLPVSLSKFRPERLDSGQIVIRWITESELNNAGFNILRSETSNGQFTKINTSLIAGQGTTSERTTYSWVDKSAKPNVVYYYQIQDVSLDGQVQTLRQSRLKGDVSPAGKITTTWGEIKALQ